MTEAEWTFRMIVAGLACILVGGILVLAARK